MDESQSDSDDPDTHRKIGDKLFKDAEVVQNKK